MDRDAWLGGANWWADVHLYASGRLGCTEAEEDVLGHWPMLTTRTPWQAATQGFMYVSSSSPHTGWRSARQPSGGHAGGGRASARAGFITAPVYEGRHRHIQSNSRGILPKEERRFAGGGANPYMFTLDKSPPPGAGLWERPPNITTSRS